MKYILWAFATVTIVVGILFSLPTPEDKAVPSILKITGADWFDGDTWHEDQGFYVVNGKFRFTLDESLKKKVSTLDYTGKFVIPGLIDAHTHTWGNALEEALQMGVTTELDMFTQPAFLNPEQIVRDKQDNTLKADIFSAGLLVTSPKGHGTQFGIAIPTIIKPEEAVEFVKQRLAEGSDYIKIVYNHKTQYGPFTSIDYATLAAVVRAAHAQDKLAVVHISNLQSARDAVKAGANGLVHTFGDALVDEELLSSLKVNKVFVIPTLSVLASVSKLNAEAFLLKDTHVADNLNMAQSQSLKTGFDGYSEPSEYFQRALKNTLLMHQSGIDILAGSDAPNPGTAHGVSMHGELWWLVQSGLTPDEALRAASSKPGARFPIGKRGKIEDGFGANFVVLQNDPRVNIQNTQSISAVFKNGQSVKLKLHSDVAEKGEALTDDTLFDLSAKELRNPKGEQFIASSDAMMHGDSKAKVEWIEAACQNVPGLLVTGEMGTKFAFAWAGALLMFNQDFTRSVDLSLYSGIQFDSQGTSGKYRLLVFVKGLQRPTEVVYSINADCQTIKLAFPENPHINWHNVTGLSWVASRGLKEFEFKLNKITLYK